MKKYLLLVLVLVATMSLSSCRRAIEKAREKIRVEAVENFELKGMSGADLTLRVVNGTRHKLTVERAELDVYYNTSRVGTVVLHDRVEVAPRATQSVELVMQFKISDPLALYVLMRKVKDGDLSQVYVSYAVEGHGGPIPVNISREMVALPEFLRTFGLSIDTLKSYMKE